MKRLLILLLFLLGSSTIASARDSAQGWCEEGNRPVITSGLTSTTRVQASHPSCIVTIYVHGGGLATIYADNNNTPLANPFTARSDGQWQFYANDGRYDVTMSSAGFSQTITYSDILLCDPFVAGAVCGGGGGGGSTPHNLLSTTHLDTIPASPPVRGDLVTGQAQISPAGTNPSWARLALGTNGQVLTSNGTDAVWGNLVAGTNITISSVGGNTTINSTGGGGGCSPPGQDRGIITEHPVGTCYDSNKALWDDTAHTIAGTGPKLFIGDAAWTVTNASQAFILGLLANKVTDCFSCWIIGTQNDLTAAIANTEQDKLAIGGFNTLKGVSEGLILGSNNSFSETTAFTTAANNAILGFSNSMSTTVSDISDCIVVGELNTVTATTSATQVIDHCQIYGKSNSISKTAGTQLKNAYIYGLSNRMINVIGASQIYNGMFGFDNEIDNTAGFNAGIYGTSNTLHTLQICSGGPCSAAQDTVIYGSQVAATNVGQAFSLGIGITLSNCTSCSAIGNNVTNSTNNTMAMGMASTPEITFFNDGTNRNFRRVPVTFSVLPACASGTEGSIAAITDSTTATHGNTITGGSTNHVLGYCNATNWVVAYP